MILEIHGQKVEVTISESIVCGCIDVQIGDCVHLMDEYSTPEKIKEELEKEIRYEAVDR